jgi:hypothetical protein
MGIPDRLKVNLTKSRAHESHQLAVMKVAQAATLDQEIGCPPS